MGLAGIIELKRKNEFVHNNKRIRLFWLSYQFAVFGIADMFTLVGLMEFFYRLSTLSFLSLSIGYYLSSIFVEIIIFQPVILSTIFQPVIARRYAQTTINAGPGQVHFRNQETRVCSVLGTKFMSRLSSSETMLALVCKTFDGVHAMESCDIEGAINRNYDLHGLGSSVGRTVDGRFRVISLANLRPYVGDFIADDLQRRLDLLKPKLPSGEIPSGFLGYAVNLVHNDKAKLCSEPPAMASGRLVSIISSRAC